jgi:diaminohydroxyphosphoribosylaminopyrimidine deaminase/5-amino-6-(5-phosphoribosylamino)uracil reductase
VFDSHARLPLHSQLLRALDVSPVWVVVAPDAPADRIAALRDAGADVLVVSGNRQADRIRSALSQLGQRDVTSLFLEGGRTLASAFMAAEQLDETRTFVAPVLLGRPALDSEEDAVSRAGGVVGGTAPEEASATAGGGGSPAATGPARLSALSSTVERVGEDVLVQARFREW